MLNYKLWTNARGHNAAVAFMSAIRIQNHRWVWTHDKDEAALWCICADKPIPDIVTNSYALLSQKPLVAYLSNDFTNIPFSEWVFFRVPLNVKILHKWLETQKLLPEKADMATSNVKWLHNPIKLSYWPNMSTYNGGSDLVMVCSRLLHDWCRYDDLLAFNINQGTLDGMLKDAVDEGNLVFQDTQMPAKNDELIVTDEGTKQNVGLFKRLFSRFSKSDRA